MTQLADWQGWQARNPGRLGWGGNKIERKAAKAYLLPLQVECINESNQFEFYQSKFTFKKKTFL